MTTIKKAAKLYVVNKSGLNEGLDLFLDELANAVKDECMQTFLAGATWALEEVLQESAIAMQEYLDGMECKTIEEFNSVNKMADTIASKLKQIIEKLRGNNG